MMQSIEIDIERETDGGSQAPVKLMIRGGKNQNFCLKMNTNNLMPNNIPLTDLSTLL